MPNAVPEVKDPYAGLLFCGKCGAPLTALTLAGCETPILYYCANNCDEIDDGEPDPGMEIVEETECGCIFAGCEEDDDDDDADPSQMSWFCGDRREITFAEVQTLFQMFAQKLLEAVEDRILVVEEAIHRLDMDVTIENLTMNRLDYELTQLKQNVALVRHMHKHLTEVGKTMDVPDILCTVEEAYGSSRDQVKAQLQFIDDLNEDLEALRYMAEVLEKQDISGADLSQFVNGLSLYWGEHEFNVPPSICELLN